MSSPYDISSVRIEEIHPLFWCQIYSTLSGFKCQLVTNLTEKSFVRGYSSGDKRDDPVQRGRSLSISRCFNFNTKLKLGLFFISYIILRFFSFTRVTISKGIIIFVQRKTLWRISGSLLTQLSVFGKSMFIGHFSVYLYCLWNVVNLMY